MKLFIWARRAIDTIGPGGRTKPGTLRLASWGRWAFDELQRVEAAMESAKLDVEVASPAQIRSFLARTAWAVPDASPARPDPLAFSPLDTREVTPASARLTFSVSRPAHVEVRFGLDAPRLDGSLELGEVAGGEVREFELSGLLPGQRYLVQLLASQEGLELRSGYHWLYTPER
jgi:hypothetical protein